MMHKEYNDINYLENLFINYFIYIKMLLYVNHFSKYWIILHFRIMSAITEKLEGTLMQIAKSPYMF